MDTPSESRERILDAAVRLLGEGGLEAFSAARVAREIGTSKANVFHHFPRLDEIPLAALERMAQQIIAAPDTSADAPPRDWLVSFGERVFSTVSQNRSFLNAYFVFFSKALFDERLRSPLKRCAAHTEALIARQFGGAQKRSEADGMAVLAASVLDGLVMRFLVFGDRGSAEAAWLKFVDLVVPEGGSS